MIFLERVRAKGFCLLKDKFEHVFEPEVYTVTGINKSWDSGSNNGSGKTTLLNAVCWGLWGSTPEGAKKDEVITYKELGVNHVHVEVHLTDLVVVRTKTRGQGEKLQFTYKGMRHKDEESTLSIVENQKKLNEYLGINFDIFCNTVHISEASKTVEILECTAGTRGELITHIVSSNTAVWTSALEFVKADEKKENRELDRTQTLIEVCEERLDELEAQHEKQKQKLEAIQIENERKRSEVRQEVRKIKRELERNKTIINGDPIYSMDKLTETRRELVQAKEQAIEGLATIDATLEHMGTFRDNDESCPMCLQLITSKTKKSLRKILNESEAERIELKEALKSIRLDLDEVEEDMENCRLERAAKLQAQENLKELRRDYVVLKDGLALTTNTLHLEERIEEIAFEINKNTGQVKKFQAALSAIHKKLEYYKRLKSYMGPEMRNFVLDRVRKKLKMYCDEFLQITTGGTFRLDFPSTNHLGKEEFIIEVYRGDVKQNIKTLSGGEKWRIRFAIILAFRSILFENVKTRFGFILIDDSLGKLDEEGIETFYNILNEGRNVQIPQALIAVPKADMVRNDDRVITMTRDFDDTLELV